MKNLTLAAIATALTCAPVAMAQTQSQLLVGTWSCSSATPDGFITAQMNYKADGTSHSTLIMAMNGGDMTGQVIMEIAATWRIPGDGTLRERVTDFDVIRFTMNGEELDSDELDSYGEEMMRDELQSGSLGITRNSLAMVDEEGIETRCVR